MRRVIVPFALTLSVMAPPAFAASYYTDVRPVIERKCVMCHSESSVSFSFEDPERTYAYREAIATAVAARRMPPWLAEEGHQAYREDISLTAAEVELFGQWADDGFPKGETRGRKPAPPLHTPFSADLSMEIMPGESYLPDASRPDDYRCFVVDWPAAERTYITGFRALPGNLRVAHHLVLFAVAPAVAERYKALDADEEGLGYQCFGGAVPDRLKDDAERKDYEERFPDGVAELNDNAFWVAQWAPGTDGYEFPEDTGIPVRPGAALIVQMHYYSAFAGGERDAGTRLEFMLGDEVDKPAFTLPLTRLSWLNGKSDDSMVIPPGARRTYAESTTLEQLMGMAAAITDTPADLLTAMEVHSANLHMHRFGSSGVISLIDRHGRQETLLSVPRWDLNWQRNFTFEQPKVFGRDEFADTEIRVECTFENPEDAPVYGGFGSDDEMCFNFSYVALVVDDEGRRSTAGTELHRPAAGNAPASN